MPSDRTPPNPLDHALHEAVTRRQFLSRCKIGLGSIALASLFEADGFGRAPAIAGGATLRDSARPLAPGPPHHAPRAKSVIYIHLAGSPPQQDLFDYKPMLREWDGKACPKDMIEERFAFIKGHPKILASRAEFAQHGDSGTWISDLLPHFPRILDKVAIVKSVHTDQFNHAPAQLMLYTGSGRLGRPSMGSWVTWGLGSVNHDLPGFVVLVSGGKTPSAGKSVWGSGFLPTVYQGVQCRSSGDPVLYVNNPRGIDRGSRRRALDALGELNRAQHDRLGDDETLSRIAQYELAFRMQASVPEAMDISREDARTLEAYGAEPGKASFANNCLLARRLVERGVRFVQLFDWGWDIHGTGPHDDLITQLPMKCRQSDRPTVALIEDLAQRGLLDETLVIWGGEFGRTAMNEERNGSKFLGRDHHPDCFTMWMAGGGIRGGIEFGATDDLGYRVIENPVGIHDLQATILHLLGLEHERLTFHHRGRDFRLTDVSGSVVHGLLA